jgi:hypothetical protein
VIARSLASRAIMAGAPPDWRFWLSVSIGPQLVDEHAQADVVLQLVPAGGGRDRRRPARAGSPGTPARCRA